MSLINVLIQNNSMINADIISSEYEGALLDNSKLEIPEIQLVYGDEEIDNGASLMIELDNELNIINQMNLNNQILTVERQDWEIDGHCVSTYLIKVTANELKLTKNDLFVKSDLTYINNLIKLFNQRNEQIQQTISYHSH